MLGALIARSKVKAGFAAMARRDVDALVSVFAEDGLLIYPIKGEMKGKAAIREFFTHFLEVFPEIDLVLVNIGVENMFDLVGTNVITTHFFITTTNRKGAAFKQEIMQLIDIKHGKLMRVHYFFSDIDNLRRAWRESES